jgi:hypothetical protein
MLGSAVISQATLYRKRHASELRKSGVFGPVRIPEGPDFPFSRSESEGCKAQELARGAPLLAVREMLRKIFAGVPEGPGRGHSAAAYRGFFQRHRAGRLDGFAGTSLRRHRRDQFNKLSIASMCCGAMMRVDV